MTPEQHAETLRDQLSRFNSDADDEEPLVELIAGAIRAAVAAERERLLSEVERIANECREEVPKLTVYYVFNRLREGK